MYLDFPGDALEPACIFETDFDRYSAGRPALVYAHIVQQDDHPDLLALQYWFFWYYNDWNNKHEGDWEGIQLLFEASSIDEALETEPVSVGYAQHEGGERADWDASKLEREGARPVVYSSAGSHASYFGSELHIGRSGSEGFGCDTTDGPSARVDPDVVVLPDSSTTPTTSSPGWPSTGGGANGSGPFNGPTGPTSKERWLEPIDWHDELRTTSVVVPGGDGGGDHRHVLRCRRARSARYVTLKTSPLPGSSSCWRSWCWSVCGCATHSGNGSIALPMVRRRRAGTDRPGRSGVLPAPRPDPDHDGLVYLPVSILVAATASVLQVIRSFAGQLSPPTRPRPA